MVLLVLLLLSVLFASAVTSLSIPDKNVCKTKECAVAAKFILDRMNSTVDPCDDFYEFACGKFASQIVNKSTSVFSDAAEEMAEHGQTALKKLHANSPKYFWQLRHYVEKCQKQVENREMEIAAQRIFLRSLGGAHLIDSVGYATSGPKNLSLEARASQMMSFGSDSLLKLRIVDVPYLRMLGMLIEVPPIDPISVDAFPNLPAVERTKIWNFQANLRKLCISQKVQKIQPIEQWSKDYPQFNFIEYLKAKTMNDLPINESTTLIVNTVAAFDFIMITYKENKQLVLEYQLIKLAAEFDVKLSECFSFAAREMDMIVNNLVAKNMNTATERMVGKAMLREMKEEMKTIFLNSQWMDKETLNKALLKLEKMGSMFAYSDYGFSDKKLLSFYKYLNTTSETFFELRMRVGELIARNNFKNASGAAIDTLYMKRANDLLNPANVNALNLPSLNKIFVTYPMMKKFMHQNAPPFLNYAGIGFIIGHEIGHGFGVVGKERDDEGIYNPQFWSNATIQAIEEKVECFVKQYNGYVEPMTKMNVDGMMTLEENMADDYGLKAAYNRAFKNQNEAMVGLPGLNYSVPQQFWMVAAAKWCIATTKSEMQNSMETNVHAVNRFRINGGFKNALEFSRDFNCPKTSQMNPVKRCSMA